MTTDRYVETLIRNAGARVAPPADRAARVRAAAESVWRRDVRARRVRRWYWAGGALAAAAALVLAVRPFLGVKNTPATPVTAVAGHLVKNGAPLLFAATIATGAEETAAIALEGGGDLRLAPNTSAELASNRSIRLNRGAIYLDSQGATPGSFTVVTSAGIVRDIGTRFEVRVDGPTATRVRVREGAVQLERGTTIDRAGAGMELSVADGRVDTRTITPFDPAWRWTTQAAPPFVVEGATLDVFLMWATREGGFTIDTSALPKSARATVLHGSVAGMSVEDALMNVLPTCGLGATIKGGRVTIRVTP
jgi:ferric-dicitrate binding protein FerR (iron transport regulator)